MRNKTIIDFAIEYINKKKKPKKILAILNYIRVYKRMRILCKLFRVNRDKRIFEIRHLHKECYIRQ